jgi:hypothetical protein
VQNYDTQRILSITNNHRGSVAMDFLLLSPQCGSGQFSIAMEISGEKKKP